MKFDYKLLLNGYDIGIKFGCVYVNYYTPKFISDGILEKVCLYLVDEGFIPKHFAVMTWNKKLNKLNLSGRKMV